MMLGWFWTIRYHKQQRVTVVKAFHIDVLLYNDHHWTLSVDPLHSYPSVKQLSQIIVSDWYKLGQTLGVSGDQLNRAKHNSRPIAAVLLAAKLNNPQLTWKGVVEGLVSIGEYATAASLCRQEGAVCVCACGWV